MRDEADARLAKDSAVGVDKSEHVLPDSFILYARPKTDEHLLIRQFSVKYVRLSNFSVRQNLIEFVNARRQIRERQIHIGENDQLPLPKTRKVSFDFRTYFEHAVKACRPFDALKLYEERK
ncbi:hypothetical protein DFP89_1031 [Paracoccus lutimaris]|uniref:Uncharacterized protein n=2 Tax=Paracoccus lutimaris TaxID=1490030 RepID=A0A368Z768_9RHOB|nr:hypothetical protein DFP89_1031 [Paracoccus lutimaris]